MKSGQLTYDGTTYRLDAGAVAELLGRGVIVADPMSPGRYDLSPDHLIEEVESVASFGGFVSGDVARGEDDPGRLRRVIAVAFQHRDGQGGR